MNNEYCQKCGENEATSDSNWCDECIDEDGVLEIQFGINESK